MMKKYPMRLRPVSKEILWGGNRLKDEYGKTAPFEKIAESWELTVREDEMCVIDNGEYTGMALDRYLSLNRKSTMGSACEKYDRFPLLIKFIDAADRLSIQVHPDNEYALANEGELGKTEMWYIMAADPGAKLVYGLREGCTLDRFAQAVAEGRTEEELGFIDVHAGEVYFIPSGQVHAIGSGILIAEIQQNSNITYRVYDYGRLGNDGKPRQLHTAKALDVIKLRTSEEIDQIRFALPDTDKNSELLCSCQYFTTRKYSTDCRNVAVINVDDSSFASLLILEAGDDAVLFMGCDELPLRKGDSVFLPAGSGEVTISGKAEILYSKVN